MRNGLVGLNAQLRTRREWPSKSPTVEPESHLQMQNIFKKIKGVRWLKNRMEAHSNMHAITQFF
jgi:hypothetical protein